MFSKRAIDRAAAGLAASTGQDWGSLSEARKGTYRRLVQVRLQQTSEGNGSFLMAAVVGALLGVAAAALTLHAIHVVTSAPTSYYECQTPAC